MLNQAENIEQSTTNIVTAAHAPMFLHRTLVITWERVIVIVLALVTLLSRLLMLGARVMSHDESLHVYYSWLLATGKGFAHNPMMHGPFLFEATALMDFLFGASDFTSRLVPVILGTAIVILVPGLLKPWLGRTAALLTSILLLISPFIFYYSRYIRHDILVITWALLAVIAIFRYLEYRQYRDLIWLATALALMLSTMEISFIYLAIFAGFLLLKAIPQYKFSWKAWRSSAEFDVLIVFTTLGAFFSSPIALLLLNPVWNKITGAPFVELQTLSTQGMEWANGASGVRLWGLFTSATLRTSIAVNYVNYDYTTEFIDYAHGAPGVKWALNDIAAIANHIGVGRDLKIAYDNEVSWPMTWYLRDYYNQAYFGAEPNRQALDAPVVIAGPKNWNKVEAILGNGYHRFELIRLWWPMEDYKNLTWDRIRSSVSNPSMRGALWDIFWNRDYRRYAELTGQPLDPPGNWPLAERMRVYVRKEIATQMLSLSISSTMLEDLPDPVDAYAAVQRSATPDRMISNIGLSAPRGLAVAPDGSIYVADTGNSRIIHLDKNGKILASWGNRTPDGQSPPAPATFNEPWGVALDSQGNVYVADTWNHRVQKFDANGRFIQEWGTLGQPADNQSNLWGPRGIVINPDGRIYVTDTGNKRIVVFDANGKFLQAFSETGNGQLDEPVGIAIGPDGLVYIADTWNLQIVVFSAEGNLITKWPVQGWVDESLDNKPYLTVDAQGRVYVTDPERYRVIAFSASGTPLAVFGQYGQEEDAFGLPVGLAVDSDDGVWVVDTGNNRLARFELWK